MTQEQRFSKAPTPQYKRVNDAYAIAGLIHTVLSDAMNLACHGTSSKACRQLLSPSCDRWQPPTNVIC